MNWRAEIVAAVLLGGTFLMILAIAEAWARALRGNPEWTRKLVHLGGGLLTLGFPFFLHSPWTVLVMAVALCGLFAAGQRWGFLRALHSVDRKTRGSEYYPLSIFLVFLLAHNRFWLYAAAILVLAAADTCAALIGSRYGRLKYSVEEEEKSLEGSLAFFLVALLSICAPMRLLTDFPLPVILASAMLVAALVTAFEAISLNGRDNLFVPLAVFVILSRITTKPQGEIMTQVVSMALIFGGIALLIGRTHAFNVGGMLVFVLFTYGVWSLGSWQWALPVFLGLLAHVLLRSLTSKADDYLRTARVKVISRALLPAFLIVAWANAYSRFNFFYGPYLAACAAILAFSFWRYGLWRWKVPDAWRIPGAALAAIAACVVLFPLPWWIQHSSITALSAGMMAVLVVTLISDCLIGAAPSFERERLWPASQFLLVVFATTAIIILQAYRFIPMWRPE